MKKVLILVACVLLGSASVFAQSVASAPEKFIIIKGKVGVFENDGVMLHNTKLSANDAAGLKAMLKADPSAGYIEVVEADGSVKSYGSAKLASTKFRGQTISSPAMQGGQNMASGCSTVIWTSCGNQANVNTTAFKASQLLKAYQ